MFHLQSRRWPGRPSQLLSSCYLELHCKEVSVNTERWVDIVYWCNWDLTKQLRIRKQTEQTHKHFIFFPFWALLDCLINQHKLWCTRIVEINKYPFLRDQELLLTLLMRHCVLTAVIVPKWANIFWDKTKSIFLKILQRFLVETWLKVLTQFIFIFTFW